MDHIIYSITISQKFKVYCIFGIF